MWTMGFISKEIDIPVQRAQTKFYQCARNHSNIGDEFPTIKMTEEI